MLVHICCSIDSYFYISKLKEKFPKERLIGFFYDPNIHPKAEYELRFFDVKRNCKKIGIKLIKGRYDYKNWYLATKYLANEPEGGSRCAACFDLRMSESIKMAKKLGENSVTSTLFASPKKSHALLIAALNKACLKDKLALYAFDFRKAGGTQLQFKMAKEAKLYHQNYCGCIYALKAQRGDFVPELFSHYKAQIQINSIEEKIKFYKKVELLEKKGLDFELIREKFLNYKLLQARLFHDEKLELSYFLSYSHFRKKLIKFSIKEAKKLYFCPKDELLLLEFELFNSFLKKPFKSLKELIENPLAMKKEEKIRKSFFSSYSLSPIIIVEKIKQGRVKIEAKSMIYEDIKEKIFYRK